LNQFGPPKGNETLFRYLTKYMPQFIISSIGGFVYNTFIVLGPIYMGKLIDAAGGGPARQVLLLAASFVGITAFFQFARYIKRWYMRDQFNRVACDLRQTFLERTLDRSLPDLEKETVGDLMSRTVGDITEVVDTVMITINEGWDTWLLMISYFITLLIQDTRTTLIASFMVPVTILIAQTMRHVLFRYSMSVRKANAISSSGLQRYLEGISVLRLFGREASEAEGLKKAYEEQTGFRVKQMLLQQVLMPVYSIVAGLGVVLVIVFIAQKVVAGAWTVGEFNAYLIMFVALATRTRVAARVFNRWHGARAAWTRVKEKMQKPEDTGKNGTALVHCTELVVQDLDYWYGENQVLDKINLRAKKGELVGITGSVGCGKTALALALTGIYPYEGSIKLDHTEVSDLNSSSRSDLISYTGHEQFLFSLSVEDNIVFSQPYDEEKIADVVESSALAFDLNDFDDGLATKVGEKGVRVSGGQRQRIALARTLYSDSDVLILDDPFSAVDIETERQIIEHLKKSYSDRIILLFTHRLTSFVLADQVIVLEDGRITERGSHDELMRQGDVYSEIFSAQQFMEAEV
jgi:ATP-binding cassette, subfamily B, multidrug efflux pump